MYLYINVSCMKEDNWFILFVESKESFQIIRIVESKSKTFIIIFRLKSCSTEMLSFNLFATKIESGQVNKQTETLK